MYVTDGDKTRNQVALTGSWVRIPPLPPKKHRNFDTMGIRISVFFFCLKVLILLAFGLLMYQQPSDKTIASATQRLLRRDWQQAIVEFITRICYTIPG